MSPDEPLPPPPPSPPSAPTPPAPAPGSGPDVRWGLGDVVAGLGLGIVASTLVSLAIFSIRGYDDPDDLSLVEQSIAQMGLWVGLLGVPLLASFRKGHGPVADYGLRMRWWPDPPLGLGSGLATQLLVLPLIYVPLFWLIGDRDVGAPARELTDKAQDSPVGVVLLFLVVVVGAPIVEELFFRGLLLRSVERRAGTLWAVVVSSLVFGLFHFQLLQLPALVAFGVVTALLTVRTQRLGPAIWAHVAFNGVTVFLLVCDCV